MGLLAASYCHSWQGWWSYTLWVTLTMWRPCPFFVFVWFGWNWHNIVFGDLASLSGVFSAVTLIFTFLVWNTRATHLEFVGIYQLSEACFCRSLCSWLRNFLAVGGSHTEAFLVFASDLFLLACFLQTHHAGEWCVGGLLWRDTPCAFKSTASDTQCRYIRSVFNVIVLGTLQTANV